VLLNLATWSGEDCVLEENLQFLQALSKKKNKREAMIKCESFWPLAGCFGGDSPQQLARLPIHAKSQLAEAVTRALSAAPPQERASCLQRAFENTITRFLAVISLPDFQSVALKGGMNEHIVYSLQVIRGMTRAANTDNYQLVFGVIGPHLSSFVYLLQVYIDSPDISVFILKFFNELVLHVCGLLEGPSSDALYEACWSLIQTYAKHKSARSIVSDSDVEDLFEDLVLFMDLIDKIATQDFDYTGSSGVRVTPSDVALVGLQTVVPLVTAELLKFPKLCKQYFSLLHLLAENFAAQLAAGTISCHGGRVPPSAD
jgi:hypothetical protein